LGVGLIRGETDGGWFGLSSLMGSLHGDEALSGAADST
jgi:hypothetical protein